MGFRLPALLLIGLLIPCSAAVGGIITDRPDFTESPVVVPDDSVQLEGGLTWLEESDGVQAFSLPELLIRWGVSDRWELRCVLPDYLSLSNLKGEHDSDSGFSDMGLGFKYQLGPSGDWDLAAILSTTVPVGNEGFTADAMNPGFILAAGRDLGPRWALGTQVSAASVTWDGERDAVLGASLVVSTDFREGSNTGTFLEAAVVWPTESDAGVVLHHGYAHLFRDNLQGDIHIGFGLTDPAPDLFIGAGLSWKR